MEQVEKNKEFILRFLRALNEASDKTLVLSRYVTDPKLIERFTFLEEAFPGFRVMVDEVTAEGNRVVARARLAGRDPETKHSFEIPFAIGYQVKKETIISHWLVSGSLVVSLRPAHDD